MEIFLRTGAQILTTYNYCLTTSNYVKYMCPIGSNQITNISLRDAFWPLQERATASQQKSGYETPAEVRQ